MYLALVKCKYYPKNCLSSIQNGFPVINEAVVGTQRSLALNQVLVLILGIVILLVSKLKERSLALNQVVILILGIVTLPVSKLEAIRSKMDVSVFCTIKSFLFLF